MQIDLFLKAKSVILQHHSYSSLQEVSAVDPCVTHYRMEGSVSLGPVTVTKFRDVCSPPPPISPN